MMDMTNAEMMVCMQMALKSKFDMLYILFKGFEVMDGGQFTGALVFTAVLGCLSELAGHIMKTRKSQLNTITYLLLKIINYSQMLLVMTYNIWIVVTLVAA